MRTRLLPLCLLPILAVSCSSESSAPADKVPRTGKVRSAMGGRDGMFEAAIDAPWRMEPYISKDLGIFDYGHIPLQISIHDANLVGADSGRFETDPFDPTKQVYVPTSPRLGRFCDLSASYEDGGFTYTKVFGPTELTEIESTTGPWKPNATSGPPHRVCRPAWEDCSQWEDIGPTSEWHAGAWFRPGHQPAPGEDLPITLTARLTRDPATSCTSNVPTAFLTITNYVRVHYGEAPLPRFTNQWIYGDLHYHAQGTDNEGESGYSYRGVMRAIGAMGVDFTVASDHASSSEQIVDVDIEIKWLLPPVAKVDETADVLRDMNEARYQMLHAELWRPTVGVNAEALSGGPFPGSRPQGYLSHRVVPRLFLGGEVDAIPEIDNDWDGKTFRWGNDLRFDLGGFCGGWDTSPFIWDGDCPSEKLAEKLSDVTLLRDVQGIHDFGYARNHLIYMPRQSEDPNTFVGSFTSKYGGATRRLRRTHETGRPLLPEIEKKGYTFLAHPVPIATCPETKYGDEMWNGAANYASFQGNQGPDLPPWTRRMYDLAFDSQAVLGMQFWNEDTRLCTPISTGDSRELGFSHPTSVDFGTLEHDGFQTGKFELQPFFKLADGRYQSESFGVEWMLHHGARQWDDLLLRSIDPFITKQIGWLPLGEPRRFFMAGGSDAHGDFNYRREGYMLGTSKITDTALAKVRNLVFAGAPDQITRGIPVMTYQQSKVFDAMADGRFAVTDGPALRIGIDRNGNDIVDASDIPMGGVVELNGEQYLPVLIEWMSTPEFGDVESVQLYVGAQAGYNHDQYKRFASTYAPKGHGPQAKGIARSEKEWSWDSNGVTYDVMKDGYVRDPTGLLDIPVQSPSGTKKILLPIKIFEASKGVPPERLYVRAFAKTYEKDAKGCAQDEVARRMGACIRRYAFSNPVWAIPSLTGECSSKNPRTIDTDGDGYPDGCDPCPTSRDNTACKPEKPGRVPWPKPPAEKKP